MKKATSPFSLSDKNILITGASSGIGRACAVAADRMGASLFLFDRDEERLHETLSNTSRSKQHRIFSLDLTNYDDVRILFETFKKEKLDLHGLVNCAGISTTTPLSRSGPEKIQHFVDINVSSGIHMSQQFARKYFISQSGASIVFIASVMGIVGEVGKTLYSITKGALTAASRSMALELAPKGIRVNCISPGVVETPLTKNAVYNRSSDAMAAITRLHPLGLGKPDDIANAVIYLLSDASRWVTGSNLVVDGGYTAH